MEETVPGMRAISKRSPLGIRHKVLGLVVLAALLPTALVGTSSYWTARTTLMEKLSDQLNTRASLTAARISEWFQERRHDARVFAESGIVSSSLDRLHRGDASAKALIGSYLQEVDGRYGVYRTLVVLDDLGEVVAAAGSRADEDLARLSERVFESGTELEFRETGALLWLESPVLVDGRRGVGRLLLVCDFETLTEALVDGEPTERIRLSASDGRPVLAYPKDAEATTTFPGRVLQEGEIVEFRDARGVAVLAASRAVPGADERGPLSVTVTTEREVAFASVTELRDRVLLLSALAVVLVVALAYGLVRSLVVPLERLTAGARAVAEGDYGTGLPIHAGDEIGYLTEVFNQMTSKLKKSHERLEHLSTTDELTQLSNRRELRSVLVEELTRAARTTRPLSIVMIDIDHFKAFNDRFGHPRGDELLARLGAYLRTSLPKGAHAARYGGEEFLVILPETTVEEAKERADALRTGFSSDAANRAVTLSLGVAHWRAEGMTAGELIEAADRALYQAKEAGRDRVVVASDEEAPTGVAPSTVG